MDGLACSAIGGARTRCPRSCKARGTQRFLLDFLDDLFEDLRDRPEDFFDDFFEGDDFREEELLFFEDDFFDDFFEDFFFVRPSLARSLFTVAAAMRLAVFVERPRFFALDSMCSYCRSSLLLQELGIVSFSFPPSLFARAMRRTDCTSPFRRRNVAWRKTEAHADRGVLGRGGTVPHADGQRRLDQRFV